MKTAGARTLFEIMNFLEGRNGGWSCWKKTRENTAPWLISTRIWKNRALYLKDEWREVMCWRSRLSHPVSFLQFSSCRQMGLSSGGQQACDQPATSFITSSVLPHPAIFRGGRVKCVHFAFESRMNLYSCDSPDFRDSGYEDYSLRRYDAMQSGRSLRAFRMNILPLSSW